MSSTVKVSVVVEELTKYGYKANGKYVNFSQKLSDADKSKVVPGASFEAEYYVSDTGKEYLNKIIIVKEVESKKEVMPPVDVERAKKFTPKFGKKTAPDNSMSREDWDKKDKRIARAGVIQAAVQAVAPLVALEAVFTEAEKLANQMLEYTRREND